MFPAFLTSIKFFLIKYLTNTSLTHIRCDYGTLSYLVHDANLTPNDIVFVYQLEPCLTKLPLKASEIGLSFIKEEGQRESEAMAALCRRHQFALFILESRSRHRAPALSLFSLS